MSTGLAPTELGAGSDKSRIANLSSVSLTEVELPTVSDPSALFNSTFWIMLGIYSIVGIPAAILSYRCSSSLEYGIFGRIFYALGAFLMGVAYLVYYVFFRSDMCKHCAKKYT